MCLHLCWMTLRTTIVILAHSLLLSRVNSQQVPVEKIVAPPGSNVTLSCSFPVKPNMDFESLVINWQRGDKVVHSFYHRSDQLDNQNEVYKGRTSLFNDQLQTGNASLMLNDIQPEHDGDYKCSVTCNNGPYGQKVQLLVAAPYDEPEIAVQYLCKNITVSLSSSHGFPEPDVTWFAPIGDEVKTLTLDSRGRYRLQSNITLNLTSTVTVRVEMSLDVLSQKFSKALTLHPQPERCENETPHCRIGFCICVSVVLIIPALIIVYSVCQRN
nr:CD276 antigen-like [Misgurnus anguillicaudatus]